MSAVAATSLPDNQLPNGGQPTTSGIGSAANEVPKMRSIRSDSRTSSKGSGSPTKSGRAQFGSDTPRSIGGRNSKLSLASRQASEDSRQGKHIRPLHPAEKKAAAVQQNKQPAMFLVPDGGGQGGGYRRGPQALHAFRRMSKADFSSIRKAGIQMRNIKYSAIFDTFSRRSTIHGVCHAALAPNPRWKKIWYAVFAICFAILVIQVFYLILKYFSFPKSVDLDLKFENAPFPSVTLCNLNPYKASAIGNDASVRATMDAFKNILKSTGRNEGIAAALANSGHRPRRQLTKANQTRNGNPPNPRTPQQNSRSSNSSQFAINNVNERRYLQVYAQCYCEINRLSGERKRGSCFGIYKGKVSLDVADGFNLHNFHPTKCLCQLDWISKSIWPCFPYNTWKEKICTECNHKLGHCPMRFYNGPMDRVQKLNSSMDVCLCHNDYNHCIGNNENGEIPDIPPNSAVEGINFADTFVHGSTNARRDGLSAAFTTTTTTTQAPEVVQAMGYEELKDEIAINAQARENLMFAVEEKPLTERVEFSQPKDELILKCSFNQRDCDIEKDFSLIYDPTYGNCYTFNWNRTEAVTAHRAGANYGLRVLMYANVSEYLPTTEAVGFRITIHDKWIVPFPDAFGHTAPTGFMSSFGVRMKKFIRIEEPHGHCEEGGENTGEYIYKGYNYSIEGCHRSCTQNEIIRLCGCADPMFPTPSADTKHCKVSDPMARECIKNTSMYLGQLIAQGKLENCKCHQPCRETGYEVSYSAARWPSGTTKLMECEMSDDLCMEKYRKNAAMIQVFYEELNYETLIESPAYTFLSLLADLGGVFGLWIGISVVSVVELVQLLNICLQAYYVKRKPSSTSSQKTLQINNYKGSISSLSNPRIFRPRQPSTPSVTKSRGSKSSLLEEIDPIKLIIEEVEDEESPRSTPPRKNTYPYLPPGAELPCTCLYGSQGNIVFMKPLCPFHGYMVRRNTGYTASSFSHGDEDSSEHSEFGDNMTHITEEEEKALAEECERQGELESDEDQKQDKGTIK
ncbi:amiloride-sensitive sodium channel domain-containing protein [Ditylenchus destructor]|nr:amiloride-sensitive sodium channel domain-containing protein [Ditylenchus destructor]